MINKFSILKKTRQCALKQASDLLWENVEKSLYWFDVAASSKAETSTAKIKVQYYHCRSTLVSLHTAFSGTIIELEDSDIKNILQYGAARRVSAIYRNAMKICNIAYLDRVEPLSQDESGYLSDSLLVIYVHIVGVMDAFAIALKRIAGDDLTTAEKNADILSAKFRKSVDFVSLEALFRDNSDWFLRVKDCLRNRFVHRVPPYVAPAIFTPEDAVEDQRLQNTLSQALIDEDWSKLDDVPAMQAKLGKFFPFISFIDSDEHMPLLPTLLDDLLRFQVLTLTVLEELIPRLAFRESQS